MTILWPKFSPPRIDEIRFSYNFCRRRTEDLLAKAGEQFVLLEYGEGSTLEELNDLLTGNGVMIVTEPETIISLEAVRALTRSLEKGYAACGPTFNRSSYPEQAVDLPVPYLNISSFVELAQFLAKKEGGHIVPVNELDPACILYRKDLIEFLPSHCLITDVQNQYRRQTDLKLAVAKDALVHLYFQKSFEAQRNDLVSLVPKEVNRVLDIGCAMGGYGKTLKAVHPHIFVTGVELNAEMADTARKFYDEVVTSPVEALDLEATYDLVNFGDILEHLKDPWKMLGHSKRFLVNGGLVVLSVPNIGHWTVVKDLLQGTFQYVPLGILCVGHVRWFTESSIRRALADTGFHIDVFKRDQLPATPAGEAFIADICSSGLGDEQSLRTNEFVIRAVSGGIEGPIKGLESASSFFCSRYARRIWRRVRGVWSGVHSDPNSRGSRSAGCSPRTAV